MYKHILSLLLILALLFPCLASAEGRDKRVYFVGEEDAVPFAEDAQTFDLYVCPLMGADSMVLTAQGETMLLDMGTNSSYTVIKDVLDDLGIERIDIAYNSHPHNDHLGSMKKVLRDYPVGAFMTGFPEKDPDNETQRDMVKAVRAADVPVITVKDGDTFTLGDARMTVIQQTKYGGYNQRSAMLRVEYGECTLLLTGDVVGAVQRDIAREHDLSADIFKLPHHGINTLYAEFLEDIDPEYAFITHGYRNTKKVQQQLDEAGILYHFATWGVIHLSSNGEYWLVEQTLTEDGELIREEYLSQRK